MSNPIPLIPTCHCATK